MLSTTLYIHIPWCIRKCPYCDFNSHKAGSDIPEMRYIDKLLADLSYDIQRFGAREVSAVFMGGGTPSLLSGPAVERLLAGIADLLPMSENIEITMEANPGTVEQHRFKAYRQAGVNRLSLGIQSFDDQQLSELGRIHSASEAKAAIVSARQSGFDNINLDLMHGLPRQSSAQALSDLEQALQFEPEHLSWYQLTLEPNTVFYKTQPTLPDEDVCATIEVDGFRFLKESGYHRYEISAFARTGKQSNHNLNYWLFGDYYGIGAGAHGKLTCPENHHILRSQKKRQPTDYLQTPVEKLSQVKQIDAKNSLFEYMLNTTRLQQPISVHAFQQHTGLELTVLSPFIKAAVDKGLIHATDQYWQVTELGRRFTNDLQAIFLPPDDQA